MGIATPKYSNKKEANKKEWLNNNPAFSESDIKFVCDRIKAFHEMLQPCTGSIQSEKKNKAWVGDKPFLHLYHAIISDDNMKLAFINCQKTLLHSKLDGCNNPEKQSVSSYELLTNRYNDPKFVVNSVVMPCYSAFKDSILLSLDDCPENVMHEQVKEHLANTECKLNIILANYEQSDMGDGHPRSQNSSDNSNSDDDGLDF